MPRALLAALLIVTGGIDAACGGDADGGELDAIDVGDATDEGLDSGADPRSETAPPPDVSSDDIASDDTSADSHAEDDALVDTFGDTADAHDELPTYYDNVFFEDRVLNIAHRGGRSLAPENTLVAFENAVAIGADVLEMDLHATADGVVVVIHDTTVDRTTDGTGRVSAMTLEEVRSLDAAYRFSSDGGVTFPYRGTGVTIPTFAEVLAAFPEMPVEAEIKQVTPSIVEAVMQEIEEHDAAERVAIASFGDLTLADVRAHDPRLVTSLGTTEMLTLFSLGEAELGSYRPPAPLAQAPVGRDDLPGLTEELVLRGKRVGVRSHAWTVNDEATMRQLIDWGVDGIITDRPDLLEALLE